MIKYPPERAELQPHQKALKCKHCGLGAAGHECAVQKGRVRKDLQANEYRKAD